jgi:hypothetical protein
LVHCVDFQRFWQPGHSPRVLKVFHTSPQPGEHAQVSDRRGRHRHDGQRTPE